MMKVLLILTGLVAFTQSRIVPASLGSTRVINGVDSLPGEIPYQVSLQTVSTSFHFCGGSVLNKNYVITAAHCVVGKTASNIKVIAATTDLRDPKVTHQVKKIIVHTGYDSMDSWRHDIALLYVEKEFVVTSVLAFVPLTQPNEKIPADSVATVSGWGTIEEGGFSPSKLQKAEILIAGQNYCRRRYKSVGYKIHSTHICAHDPVVSTGSCHGDSGGPLTHNGRLVGLVSWALGCANTDYPTVYTAVAEYHDWIKANAV